MPAGETFDAFISYSHKRDGQLAAARHPIYGLPIDPQEHRDVLGGQRMLDRLDQPGAIRLTSAHPPHHPGGPRHEERNEDATTATYVIDEQTGELKGPALKLHGYPAYAIVSVLLAIMLAGSARGSGCRPNTSGTTYSSSR